MAEIDIKGEIAKLTSERDAMLKDLQSVDQQREALNQKHNDLVVKVVSHNQVLEILGRINGGGEQHGSNVTGKQNSKARTN